MTGRTLKETHHGNPGETCRLPAGLLVKLQPATNLPNDSPIKYWASPLPDHPWAEATAKWAAYVGVGLQADDVEILKGVCSRCWSEGPMGERCPCHDDPNAVYVGGIRLDEFTKSYIATAGWSSTDCDDTPLDENYDETDIHPETLAQMIADCAKFQADHADLINDDNVAVESDHCCFDRAGHDFWLTRNGHGAGFWDGDWKEPAATKLTDASKAFGEVNLYVDDDGKIYS